MDSISGNWGQGLFFRVLQEEPGTLTDNSFQGTRGGLTDNGGDTLEISQEARELLAAKMREHGANTPEDLTPEERDDIRHAMAESDEVTDADREALDKAATKQGQGEAQGAKRKGPPQEKGGSDEESDEIKGVKDEIDELEEEIEELQAKALDDEEAKRELKSKRIDLSLKETELTLLEQKARMA